MEFVNLDELLKVVEWLFENDAGGHLTNKVVAHAYERQLRLFVKLWVVH
jgi:hypothetical protein